MKTFLRKINSLVGMRDKRTLAGIKPAEEFHGILRRECARTDRTGGSFSVVLFDISYLEDKLLAAHLLIQILVARARSSDEIGWFDKSRVAIFLHATTGAGAQTLANDICSEIAKRKSHLSWQIYTYPVDWISGTDRNSFRHCDTHSVLFDSELPVSKVRKVKIADRCYVPEAFKSQLIKRISIWKRSFDIIGALLALIIFSPIFLLIAIMIKLVSSGPIFFKQERVGYLGKPFTMYKFRTMKLFCSKNWHQRHLCDLIQSDKAMEKLECDNLIIPFGKLLRNWCLDELPQLFNVLRGEMSLVGPRPAIAYEVAEYAKWFKRRFDTVPGMTGLWQVSGKNRLTFKEMIRLDIRYAAKKSFWLDLKIVLLTPNAIFTQVLDNLKRKINPTEGVSENV